MAKISLNKLNLDKKSKTNVITINEQEVEVFSYLPISEKMNLIELVVQESMEERKCNPILVDALFHTYLVLSYTNISLTANQSANLLEVYDILERSGVIADVVETIPSYEYEDLKNSLYSYIDVVEFKANSIVTLIEEGIDKVMNNIGNAAESLNSINFDSEALQNVMAIAKSNGAI